MLIMKEDMVSAFEERRLKIEEFLRRNKHIFEKIAKRLK